MFDCWLDLSNANNSEDLDDDDDLEGNNHHSHEDMHIEFGKSIVRDIDWPSTINRSHDDSTENDNDNNNNNNNGPDEDEEDESGRDDMPGGDDRPDEDDGPGEDNDDRPNWDNGPNNDDANELDNRDSGATALAAFIGQNTDLHAALPGFARQRSQAGKSLIVEILHLLLTHTYQVPLVRSVLCLPEPIKTQHASPKLQNTVG